MPAMFRGKTPDLETKQELYVFEQTVRTQQSLRHLPQIEAQTLKRYVSFFSCDQPFNLFLTHFSSCFKKLETLSCVL